MQNPLPWWQIVTALFSTLAVAISVAISVVIYRRFTNKIQSHEVSKSNALGDVFFHYEATPKVYHENGKTFIEIEVKLTNKSSRKLGLLAIFVKFKPIINSENQNEYTYKSFDQLANFESTELEKKCSLLQLKNIAYAKDFIWQTSIDGISVRRSFDLVDQDFCKKYPLVMAQIIIFGAAMDHIDKTHYPIYEMKKLRMPWCKYADKKENENYVFFSRMGAAGFEESEEDKLVWKLKHGERILIKKDGSFDAANTKEFEPLLQSIINSNIEKVVDLRQPKSN